MQIILIKHSNIYNICFKYNYYDSFGELCQDTYVPNIIVNA